MTNEERILLTPEEMVDILQQKFGEDYIDAVDDISESDQALVFAAACKVINCLNAEFSLAGDGGILVDKQDWEEDFLRTVNLLPAEKGQ